MKILYTIRRLLFGSKLIRSCSLNKKSIIKEEFNDLIDRFYDLYTNLIIIPYETISRFFYWGWKLRHNYSWDCTYLLYDMIYLKLNKLIEYSKQHAHLCWNSNPNTKEMRKLRIACHLSKRLANHDYSTHMTQHDNEWGKLYMEFGESKGLHRPCYLKRFVTEQFPHLKNKERKEWHIAQELDENQRKHEKEYLFHLLKKHLERWWD